MIDVDTYALVGEAVYGRGRAGQGTDGRTNDDRGKDVVPLYSHMDAFISICKFVLTIFAHQGFELGLLELQTSLLIL